MSDRSNPLQHAAYGGPGWRPRTRSLAQDIGSLWGSCGQNSEYARLKKVLLHRPGEEIISHTDPNQAQMLEPLDLAKAQKQHEEIANAYLVNGVDVSYLDPSQPPTPNQMFMADLFFMTHEGVIIGRPASMVRAGEERQAAERLSDMGIPILRSISGFGTFEGADAMYVTPKHVILGRGMRTNLAAIEQLVQTFASIGVVARAVDLPVGSMHLMGLLRIVDRDLAIGYPTRLVYSAVDYLNACGLRVEFLPDLEETVQQSAFNFVTLGPRKILMPGNNPTTQAFFESLGITCVPVVVDELSKAAGAIGCLSGIVEREILTTS